MNVFVTGGVGYIGRFCLRALLAAGHRGIAFDRRDIAVSTANIDDRVRYVVGELADAALIERLLRTHAIDVVLHLAAEKSVADAMAAPGPHLTNNVGGTLALLEAMRRAGVSRIVFSSSAAVYGTPDRLPVDETAALRPENPYGAGKIMVEEILHWYRLSHGFDSVSLRYFNAAGAAEDGSLGEDANDSQNLLPRVMAAVLGRRGPVRVYGTDFPTPDGTAVRDYVHVEDIAAAHLRALEHVMTTSGAEAFNVGTGRGTSVREVLEATERAVGRAVPSVDAPRRPGDPAAIWANAELAGRVLGWHAERDFETIVRTAWLWHRTQGLDGSLQVLTNPEVPGG